jgi:ATP-dependent DNA helicase RecG
LDRLEQTLFLDTGIHALRFAQGVRARGLERLGITSVRDLLTHFPTRYNDFSQVIPIRSLKMGERLSVMGTVDEVKIKRPRRRLSIIEVSLLDASGALIATWFNQPWLAKTLKKGMRLMLLGKAEHSYGYWRMSSPLISPVTDEQDDGTIHPVYRANSDITSAWIARLVTECLTTAPAPLDPLPPALRAAQGFMSRQFALRAIHRPLDEAQRAQAHRRLAFEEVYLLQLFMMRRRNRKALCAKPFVHRTDGPAQRALRQTLPFTLTDDQTNAILEINADLSAEKRMNRLLLGDVGSGKTIVAAFALAAAHDSGAQAAMMAPTEVLAEQYAQGLGPILDAIGVPWALLTSQTPPAERSSLLEALATGRLSVLFGTHALIEPDVHFANLSLVIIDEQHRFGVAQRTALRDKGPASDFLAMTATPIPRSLALTIYGDMEASFIRTRPNEEARRLTNILPRSGVYLAYEAIRKALERGEQAYIICPLITNAKHATDAREAREAGEGAAGAAAGAEGGREAGAGAAEGAEGAEAAEGAEGAEDEQLPLLTEFSDLGDGPHIKAAEEELAFLRAKVFPERRIELMTSRLPAAVKRATMNAFRRGDVDILVSTTVVEVGIDVPNATVMLIQDADRFGLSQLHQLRGRVGRGKKDAEIFLVAGSLSDEARVRLEAMERTDDGFELAEYDLRLRKEGDILGSRQHGLGHLRLVNVVRDAELITIAHREATELLSTDPLLEQESHCHLAWELEQLFSRDEELL